MIGNPRVNPSDGLDGLVDNDILPPVNKKKVLSVLGIGAIVLAGAAAVVALINNSDKPYHENLYFRGYETERAGEGRSNVRQVWQKSSLSQGKDENPIQIYQEANMPTAYDDKLGQELIVGQIYHVDFEPRAEGFYTVKECRPVGNAAYKCTNNAETAKQKTSPQKIR